MSPPSAQHSGSRLARILRSTTVLSAAALVLLYTLAGFFLTPYLVKRQLTDFVSEDLHRQLAIEQVRFNPYTLRMVMDRASLSEGNGDPLLGFRRLVVDFDISSLWQRAWTFAEISLEEPELTLAIDTQGEMNLKRLLGDLPAEPEPKAAVADAPPPRLLLRRLHIGQGSIHLVDRSQPTPADTTLSPLDLEVHDLTSIPQREGPHQLVARLPGGGTLEWRGEASLYPVHSLGRIGITGLKPANAWRYFQDFLNIEEPGGSLNLETGYRFALEQEGMSLTLDGLKGELSALTLTPRGASEPVLTLGSTALDGGTFDLGERRLSFAGVTLARGKVSAQFDPKGVLNWEKLAKPSAPASQMAPSSPTESPSAPAQPWRVDLGKVLVTEVAMHGTDLSREVPIDMSFGGIDVTMQLAGEFASDKVQTKVDGFAATISDVKIAQREDRKSLASLAEIKLEGGALDLNDRRIAVKNVAIRGGELAIWRDPDGQINWVQQALDPGVVRGDAREARVRAESEGRPWSIAVKTLRVSDTSASFADQALTEPTVLDLSGITLNLTDVSMDPQQPIGFDVALQVQQGGAVLAKGTVQPFQPRVDGTVEIKQIALTASQPYIQNVAHMRLEAGQLSGGGEVHYGSEQPGSLKFTGDIDIAGLKVLEPHTGKTLIGWDGLKTKGMQLGLAPNGLTLEEVVLRHPKGTFVIDENKDTNWQYALKDQSGNAPTEPTSAAATAAFRVSIARIRIEDGALNFADLSLTPQFATDIHELNGSIAGLSTAPGAKANIELQGRVDEYGEAEVHGEIEPSSPTATTDIHMAFQNVEMADLVPYTIKFAGYQVTSGKLSLDLGYKIQQHQLTGDNRILVQHLELGEKVDSPDALDLPLELGLALLKDPSGKIDINLPVKGDMSDPQFNFGQLVGKALANFFGKLVTAPFQIIAGILGAEGEHLDQITFEPGRSDLPPPEQEKLAMVAKALRERPELAVSIEGTYDSRRDGAVLKELQIRRAVAEARGDGSNPGQDPGPVSYNDPKSQQALEQVFSKRVSPTALTRLKAQFAGTERPATTKDGQPAAKSSPQTAVGGTGGLYEAIYEELVNTAVITHKELRALGTERAKSVQRELTRADGIPAQRVSLAAPAKTKRSSAKAVGVVTRLDLTVAK